MTLKGQCVSRPMRMGDDSKFVDLCNDDDASGGYCGASYCQCQSKWSWWAKIGEGARHVPIGDEEAVGDMSEAPGHAGYQQYRSLREQSQCG